MKHSEDRACTMKVIKLDNVALSAFCILSYFMLSYAKVMHMRVKKKRHRKGPLLTLPVPCISESYIEVKIKFFFHSLFSDFFHSLFSHFFVVLQKFL